MLKTRVFGSFNLDNSKKYWLFSEDILWGTLDTSPPKKNPHLTVLRGMHGKVCWLLAYIVDYLNFQKDNNKTPVNFYLELSKAFDSLKYNILLRKLYHCGIQAKALNLMTNYIQNRKQFVQLTDCSYDMKLTHIGVPQGFLLGLLLFLLCINNLLNSSKPFNFLKYPDDTTLYCCIEYENREMILNEDLTNVDNWLLANKLNLNVTKTKCIVLPSKKLTTVT